MLRTYNVKSILRNVNLVFKTNDINKLNKPAYDFLYLISGFIAHCNINGFKYHYTNIRLLIDDLLNSSDISSPEYYDEEYFIKEYGKDYCKSKVETLMGLKVLAERYKKGSNKHFSNLEKVKDINTIKRLLRKHNIKKEFLKDL